MKSVRGPVKVSIFGQEPPECCTKRVTHPLATCRSHLGSQGEAGSGVHCLGQRVNDLLYMFNICFLAAVEVFYVDAGEAVGVFQATKAGAVWQRIRIRPSHLGGCARMSRSGLRLAIYAHGCRIEACRAPQWLTQLRIFIGPPRSGW